MSAETKPSESRFVMMPGIRLGASLDDFLRIPRDASGRTKLDEAFMEANHNERKARLVDASGQIWVRGK